MGNSIGLFAPTGTPKMVIDRVAQASRRALEEPAFQHVLIDAGYEPDLDSNPDKFRRSLEQDVVHWTPVVKKLGLKID
jgi:tripartite-type tricarboxylate transporter receptor subunit TctC